MSRAIFEAATGYRAPPPLPAVESFSGRNSIPLERVHALTRESVEEAKGRLGSRLERSLDRMIAIQCEAYPADWSEADKLEMAEIYLFGRK